MKSQEYDNQSGFGTLELLLVLIIIALLGLVGWLVYSRNHQAPKSQAAEQKTTLPSQQSATQKPGPYAGWATVSTTDKAVTVKVPQSWKVLNCDGANTSVYTAESEDKLAHCASDFAGQVSISYENQDNSASLQKTQSACDKSFSMTQVTVSGTQGYRIERTDTPASSSCIMSMDGRKFINYYFFKNGKSYYLSYVQIPTWADDSATFDLIAKSATF